MYKPIETLSLFFINRTNEVSELGPIPIPDILLSLEWVFVYKSSFPIWHLGLLFFIKSHPFVNLEITCIWCEVEVNFALQLVTGRDIIIIKFSLNLAILDFFLKNIYELKFTFLVIKSVKRP